MSHIATYGTSLCQVNSELINQTLEIVAEQLGGEKTNSITDYYGKELTEWNGARIINGIKTRAAKRGVGITIKNGVLQFVGDDYGCTKGFAELKEEIELTYKKLALARALQELDYEIDIESHAIGTIFHGSKK